MLPPATELAAQLMCLFILAIPVACIAWTVAHEELLRETRELCHQRSQNASTFAARKFFYLFTCEYCFSHYVAACFIALCQFSLSQRARDRTSSSR